jgi:hypothetical protein
MASGLPVSRDMEEVVEAADAVVATGMTLSNGSFDVLLDRCLQQEIPFPFSQFSSCRRACTAIAKTQRAEAS